MRCCLGTCPARLARTTASISSIQQGTRTPRHGTMQEAQWQHKTGRHMILATILLSLGFLTWLFEAYLDSEAYPNRHIQTMTIDGQTAIQLKRNRTGHYLATVRINGQEVDAMLDTGATVIGIPGSMAKRLQLVWGMRGESHTAAGRTTVFNTVLDSVQIGPLRQETVRGVIIPEMEDRHALIGMNFLKHLNLSQRGDTLILQQP